MPLVYTELKRISRSYLGDERSGHTLQPTALVHEACLRLARYHEPRFESRKHFYAAAAQTVRRILVDHARHRDAAKRDASSAPPECGLALPVDVDVLALDEALRRLGETDPEKVRTGELRYFAGPGFLLESRRAGIHVS